MKTIVLAIIIVFVSCNANTKPDLGKEEKTIRALLQQERKAHFDRNANLFISEFADSMINVSKGNVNKTSLEENRKRIGAYFGSSRFIKWDDVADPQVRFSDDGSLAYAIVQKQVILSSFDSVGKETIDTTNYAWVSIYRKRAGKWKVETNISTNK
jgi:hypothetical protein